LKVPPGRRPALGTLWRNPKEAIGRTTAPERSPRSRASATGHPTRPRSSRIRLAGSDDPERWGEGDRRCPSFPLRHRRQGRFAGSVARARRGWDGKDLFRPRRHGEASPSPDEAAPTSDAEAWAPARANGQAPATEDHSAPAPEVWRRARTEALLLGSGQQALSEKAARIDRTEQGRRHFGALTRRRARRFGARLACGARDALSTRLGGGLAPSGSKLNGNAATVPSGRVSREVGGTGNGTHTTWSGCWTWYPSRLRCAPPGESERGSSLGSGCAGSGHDAGPFADRNRRKAARPIANARTEPRFAEVDSTRRAGRAGTTTARKVEAPRRPSPTSAEGYQVARRRPWKDTEAHGSIGRSAGGNASTAQRTRRWSKALRPGKPEASLQAPSPPRGGGGWKVEVRGPDGEKATTTVTWNGCRRGESFEGWSATGDGPGTA
jgi:hypothetical protein